MHEAEMSANFNGLNKNWDNWTYCVKQWWLKHWFLWDFHNASIDFLEQMSILFLKFPPNKMIWKHFFRFVYISPQWTQTRWNMQIQSILVCGFFFWWNLCGKHYEGECYRYFWHLMFVLCAFRLNHRIFYIHIWTDLSNADDGLWKFRLVVKLGYQHIILLNISQF